jgi:lysophospholipase L1-like esterase
VHFLAFRARETGLNKPCARHDSNVRPLPSTTPRRRRLTQINGSRSGGRRYPAAAFLPVCLHSHKPLDIVILFLGTNDLFLPSGISAH